MRPLIFLLAALSAAASDWPQWRGLNRDATWTETGILEKFPEGGPRILWRAPIGAGFSTPVTTGDRVFVSDTTWEKPNVTERAHCFDLRTGRKIWSSEKEVKGPAWFFTEGQARGPGATPIVHDGRLHLLGCFGLLRTLDAKTGKLIWEKDLVADYQLDNTSLDASPLIYKNLLIVFAGGKPGATVLAFDRKTGKEVWRALDEPVGWSSPLLVNSGAAKQLIVWTRTSVTALDPLTGRTLWREPLNSNSNASVMAVATPIQSGDRLLISGMLFGLDPRKPGVSWIWPADHSLNKSHFSSTSSPLFLGDAVYSAKSNGELVCLDARSGETLWSTNGVTKTRSSASIHMTQNGSTTFLFTDEGNLITARLSRKGYTELSRAPIVEPSWAFGREKVAWAAPAFAHQRALVRNDKEIVCVDLKARSR